jgi:hypothetical protein
MLFDVDLNATSTLNLSKNTEYNSVFNSFFFQITSTSYKNEYAEKDNKFSSSVTVTPKITYIKWE